MKESRITTSEFHLGWKYLLLGLYLIDYLAIISTVSNNLVFMKQFRFKYAMPVQHIHKIFVIRHQNVQREISLYVLICYRLQVYVGIVLIVALYRFLFVLHDQTSTIGLYY